MANSEHLAILKQGVTAWNEWRLENPIGADLRRANLRGADLSEALLREADLRGAFLIEADLSGAGLGYTIFANIDLSEVIGLKTVRHTGPSSIGIDTIYQSKGKIPEAFLRDAGVPDNFINYMASLVGQAFDFYSCFISYSSKDGTFAKRLHAGLQSNGVRCWFAPHDLRIGAPYVAEIDRAIRLYDKLLLVLSENSVKSDWVESEVMVATTKERKQSRKPGVLFPVRIDDAIMNTDVEWAEAMRYERHIGDFTQWREHDAYQKGFDRLLRDLKQSEEEN